MERVREIKYTATRDLLTGVYNRDYLFDVGEKLYASARRGDISLTLAMIEIDNFEDLTTQHSPKASNTVLETLAPLLSAELRQNDILARYDASTFVCLISNVGKHNAIMVCERLKQLVTRSKIEYQERTFSVSCSIGATTDPDDSLLKMIGNAHHSLQEAIEKGRNCVVVTDATTTGS